MKKTICIILTILLCIGSLPFSTYAKESTLYAATMNIVSTEYGYDTSQVYIYEDDCYMYIKDIVRYTRSAYKIQGDTLTVTHGSRELEIDLESNTLTEDGIIAEMKTLRNGNTVVVHAYPMLTYLGAKCSIENELLVINMPVYTVWEGLSRTYNENYFTLETFGNNFEQNTRLILNGILNILESGLSEALFDNSMKEAFTLTMQVDPLKYNGGWEIKASSDSKYNSLVTAMIAANDFSPEFKDLFESSTSAIDNIVFDYLNSAYEDDTEYLLELKGVQGLFEIASTTMSFISNLSANSKCTDDSLDMIKAFSKHTTKHSAYNTIAMQVQAKVESQLTSALDAARDTARETLADKIIDDELEDFGKSGYLYTAKLIEESINISVWLHKAFYGENNAFAYSSAETSAINLLILKKDLLEIINKLGEKIIDDNYSNEQDIEDYRLLNVFYYRALIAANEQLEAMIFAQGRQNDTEIVPILQQLHINTDNFAKNLYILTTSTGTAFPDLDKISKSNNWDGSDVINNSSKKVPNGLDGLGNGAMTLVLSGIEADSIQYYNCSESGNFAVIEKDGKFGVIGYDGELILPIRYDDISQGGGYSYNFLVVTKDSEWGYHVDENGNLQYGCPHGGGVEPVIYWYKNDYVSFHPDFENGIMYRDGNGQTADEDWWYDYMFTPQINLRVWEDGCVLPVQNLVGLENTGWFPTPLVESNLYGFLDMNTGFMVSDFIYEDFDQHNGFNCGLLAVKKNGKWGFVDESGNVVVDFQYDPYDSYTAFGEIYDSVYGAVNDYIAVTQNGKWGLLDKQGNIVVDVAYDGISQVNPEGMFWLQENGSWSLYKLGT